MNVLHKVTIAANHSLVCQVLLRRETVPVIVYLVIKALQDKTSQ